MLALEQPAHQARALVSNPHGNASLVVSCISRHSIFFGRFVIGGAPLAMSSSEIALREWFELKIFSE